MAACGAGARQMTMKAHSVAMQVITSIYNPSLPQAAGWALVVGTFACVLSLLSRLLACTKHDRCLSNVAPFLLCVAPLLDVALSPFLGYRKNFPLIRYRCKLK